MPIAWADGTAGCIRFEETKTGAQIRPIAQAAFDALDESPHRNGWAFPAARGEGHFVGLPHVLERLC